MNKSCWHQRGWKLVYSSARWEQRRAPRWSRGQWITNLSFIIPWLSLTFKKLLTPLRFTLVYISYGSTSPSTHRCARLLLSHRVFTLLCVCVGGGNNLSDNASPNDPTRAVNYTLIRFSHLPLFCEIKGKRFSTLLLIHWHFGTLISPIKMQNLPLCSFQLCNKWTPSVCCLGVTASVNGNHPPIHSYVQAIHCKHHQHNSIYCWALY